MDFSEHIEQLRTKQILLFFFLCNCKRVRALSATILFFLSKGEEKQQEGQDKTFCGSAARGRTSRVHRERDQTLVCC